MKRINDGEGVKSMATLKETAVATRTAADIEKMSLAQSKGALVAAQELDAADTAKVYEIAKTINMSDTNSIISFGVDAQRGLTEHSDCILKGVRNKDTGPAGEVMNNLMVQVRTLGLDSLDPNAKQSLLGRIFKSLTPVQKFIQSYETIESQVDSMVSKLEREKQTLSRDIIMLDGMYEEALKFFHDLELYIKAANLKLDEVNTVDVPALVAQVEASDSMEDTQALRDLQERALDLERKINDLLLTRTATMQLLPQLRMIQDVDKGLVNKIQSSILVTIPMWKTQIAMAITLWRQASAIKTEQAVADATNEMMVKNAALLKQGSGDARRAMERGVVDIETLKKVNGDLIETIKEATQIAIEGKKARVKAQSEMVQLEADLKTALKDAANS
jgi:uncharacterized protein YaaN involved in tellurite resistance